MKVYCVIPARGGSKRIPQKNIANLLGKPLLLYAVEAAKDSGIFDDIIVNSDDRNICDLAVKNLVNFYHRPINLATDEALLIDVIKEMLNTYKLNDDSVLGILHPTNPLRTVDDIIRAFDIFKSNDCKCPVVSVSENEHPIQLSLVINGGHVSPLFSELYEVSSRPADYVGHHTTYRYNEAVLFNSVGRLKVQKNLIGDNPIPYVMPKERSVSIDYPYQFDCVRGIMEGGLYEKSQN